MQVEKHWAELLMLMCEDERGHVRASEELVLMQMWIENFFTKLLVFKERIDKRVKNVKQNG